MLPVSPGQNMRGCFEANCRISFVGRELPGKILGFAGLSTDFRAKNNYQISYPFVSDCCLISYCSHLLEIIDDFIYCLLQGGAQLGFPLIIRNCSENA